jgi:hypothetical protein
MAGIQALIDQKTGAKWGNPNPVYYAMAKAEYATAGLTSYCNSNTVPKIGNICIFYDITQGDNDSVCQANSNGIPINCAIPRETRMESFPRPAILTNLRIWRPPVGTSPAGSDR